ncbi:MAG: helix-turn-helix transcriptional regulator [Agathobacter sp.]|nr:helix-turn-helix transcriptional regulator [Agathobacter sp.]
MNAEYTGKKISELRKEKNMTQKELADKLHVTDKAVSKWERGANFPDLGLMEELAVALDTTPSILLGLENATKEEIVNSFAEISNQQSEEAEKEIQQVGWITLFAGIFLIIFLEPSKMHWSISGLLGAIVGVSIYVLKKYKAVGEFELLDTVLAEVIVADGFIFLLIQLVTGSNPHIMVSAIIIGIAVICAQMLFYRVMKPQWMKFLPVVVSLCWLMWGVLLELSKANWENRYWGEFAVYSILPFVCCIVTWFVCRKLDVNKENILSSLKPFAIVFATALLLICLLGQDLIAKTYVMVFHKNLESYAEELLDKVEDASVNDENIYSADNGLYLVDKYGFWEVTCYSSNGMVEFMVGGKGLVFNSTYWGFYYSPDNTHKVYQGADIPLNVNNDLADWYGEGDNWGKSIRLRDKWFWFEASF